MEPSFRWDDGDAGSRLPEELDPGITRAARSAFGPASRFARCARSRPDVEHKRTRFDPVCRVSLASTAAAVKNPHMDVRSCLEGPR